MREKKCGKTFLLFCRPALQWCFEIRKATNQVGFSTALAAIGR